MASARNYAESFTLDCAELLLGSVGIAESLAIESSSKASLATASRLAENAQVAMQEANTKAADADTQARFCEGNKFRRRRTCACDDTVPPEKGTCAKSASAPKHKCPQKRTRPRKCTTITKCNRKSHWGCSSPYVLWLLWLID